jgi:hypothetical protein
VETSTRTSRMCRSERHWTGHGRRYGGLSLNRIALIFQATMAIVKSSGISSTRRRAYRRSLQSTRVDKVNNQMGNLSWPLVRASSDIYDRFVHDAEDPRATRAQFAADSNAKPSLLEPGCTQTFDDARQIRHSHTNSRNQSHRTKQMPAYHLIRRFSRRAVHVMKLS